MLVKSFLRISYNTEFDKMPTLLVNQFSASLLLKTKVYLHVSRDNTGIP